jgi:D-xylose transport system substrate-binding protein
VLLTPVAVTKGNVKSTVIKDRYDTVSQVCTPALKAACNAAGIK